MKGTLEARKNRWRRSMMGSLGESLRAAGLLMAAVFLTLGFIYAYSTLLSAAYFEIREISVRGVRELTEKDIMALAKVRLGSNILSVNAQAIAERIAANAWVKHIYVGRELPDRLVLDVRERRPVAMVRHSGTFYLMDGHGYAFKKLSGADNVDLAILSGVNVQEKTLPPIAGQALKLLELLSDTERYGFIGAVSEMQISEVFGVSLVTEKGLHVKLGHDQFEEKLRQLAVVLADLEKRGARKGYLFVDLADISKVTVRHQENVEKTKDRPKGPQYKL